MRKTGSRLALSASLFSFATALASPAQAQDNATSAPAPAPAPAPPAVDQANDNTANANEPIIVTGSLIRRPNNSSASPIVTLGTEAIKQSGQANLSDALNQLPGFTTAGNAATGGQGTGGRATINLHGLGSNRNLVLLDGKRLPLSDIAGNVDINIIPESIIEGVDVITGGASAVYGSDAMSGVVNFKTLTNFEGIRADGQYNISERGDAAKYAASVALGSKFAEDRGHVLAAFSYTKQDPLQGSERAFFHDKVPSSYIGYSTFIPSATNAPSAAVVTGLFNSYGVAGARNPLDRLGINDNGTLFVQNGGQNYLGPTDANGYMLIGGNVRMPVGQQIQTLNSLERKTAFVKADYDLAPALTLYGQFLYVDLNVNTASGGSLTQFPTLTTIPVTNPFIPADLATVLASRPDPTANFAWNARYVGVPYKNWDESFVVQQYMAGLRGDIAAGWSFDVFASYDQSKHTQVMHNAVLKTQVQKLLSAPDGGASLCQGGFNPFGDANARSLSPACVAFITKDATSIENLDQAQAQAQVNGTLFDLGAGPAQIAVLADYRRNSYAFSPDFDLTAASGWAPGGNIEGVVNTLALPKTSISVKEIAAQVDVPLLSNKRFFEELAIGAAGRISDYSVTGSVKSYELDARWRPVNILMIRAGYQRAVRAPNIGELFSPQQGNQLVIGTPPGGLGDPCDVRSTARNGTNAAQVAALCVAQGVPSAAIGSYQFPTTATGQITSGNSNLTPETADTFNIGAVFNMPAGSGIFSDFSLSVDYYNIRIKNVISAIPGLTVLSKCFNLDGSNSSYSATNDYCQLVRRDSAGQLLNVQTPYLNLGGLRTDGVEAQIHWGLPTPFLGQTGRIYIDSTIGWLHTYKVQILPGAPFLDYTGVSNGGAGPNSVPPRATPKWKALSTLGYRSDTLGLGARWRYQGALADVTSVLTPSNVQVGVPAYNLWDLFGTVKVMGRLELRAGVNNLFDTKLPYVASSQNATDAALYDVIGRSYYVGARLTF